MGVAVGFGDTASVGIGGLTTGGGIGYLVRRVGMTIDSVLAAEVVTADGQVHTSTRTRIRTSSGRCAAAAATSAWSRSSSTGSIRSQRSGRHARCCRPRRDGGWLHRGRGGGADELSTIANVMPTPPMPFVPEEGVGKLSIMGMLGYAGDAEAGERADRAVPGPGRADRRHGRSRCPTRRCTRRRSGEEYHPLAVACMLFVDRVDLPVAERSSNWLNDSDAPMRVAQLRVLGGAMARCRPTPRPSRIGPSGSWSTWPPSTRAGGQAVAPGLGRGLRDALRGDNHAAYVNFLGDEGEARPRRLPGGTWDRLAEVKAQYDPGNLFRLNQNVAPA